MLRPGAGFGKNVGQWGSGAVGQWGSGEVGKWESRQVGQGAGGLYLDTCSTFRWIRYWSGRMTPGVAG